MTPHLSPHSVRPSLLDYSDQHNEDLLSAIHSDFRKKKFKKKSFRLAEAGFSDFVTQTKQLFF